MNFLSFNKINILNTFWLNISLIDIDIIINVKNINSSALKHIIKPIYGLRGTINNSKHCIKNNRYDL